MMLLIPLFVAVSTLILAGDASNNWAVLIAGSNYFYNYRHQSDVCHAYQIVSKRGGIPESNIILMMFDDIAYNTQNPFPGQIFNKPNGTNVYKNVKISYRGQSVNKTTFIKVLKGDTSAGGPVLQSTAQDDVFVYFADHGATGLVAMPSGDPLYADELMATLKYMHTNKMYRRLVFYIEACESGSMFADGLLPSNVNIFGTTAANPSESSYAYYFDEAVGAYLGDEYSIRWMEDSDKNWSKDESLITQFNHVKNLVKQSHPQVYGVKQWDSEPINDFQGDNESNQYLNLLLSTDKFVPSQETVDSRDVKLFHLMKKYLRVNGEEKTIAATQMNVEMEHRVRTQKQFETIVSIVTESSSRQQIRLFMTEYNPPKHFDCLRYLWTQYEMVCETFSDFSLKFVRVLVNLCEKYGRRKATDAILLTCA